MQKNSNSKKNNRLIDCLLTIGDCYCHLLSKNENQYKTDTRITEQTTT